MLAASSVAVLVAATPAGAAAPGDDVPPGSVGAPPPPLASRATSLSSPRGGEAPEPGGLLDDLDMTRLAAILPAGRGAARRKDEPSTVAPAPGAWARRG